MFMNSNPTAQNLLDYLLTLAKVPEKTVDRIIFGPPELQIKKIGTCDRALRAFERTLFSLHTYKRRRAV